METEVEFRQELQQHVEAQRVEPTVERARQIARLLQAARDKGFYPMPEKARAALLR